MRSPSLLTGVTGTVAVLVLVYVGLTAMNLQPHITFGDPKVQVASADAPPERAAAPAPVASSPAPAPSPPQPATAEPSPTSPPSRGTGEPAGNAPPVTTTELPAASTDKAAPVPPAAADMPPSVPAAPSAPPPVVAAPAPEATPVPAPSTAEATAPTPPVVASPPPAGPPAAAAPDAASPLPAQPERTPPVAVNEPPSSQAEDRAISERMAPSPAPTPLPPPTPPMAETPPTPPTPLAASVPTPLARPRPPAEERLASAEASPSDASRRQTTASGPATPSNDQASPTQSAALAPQPEKPASDPATIEQPNGDLKPIDLARPFAERAGILTVGGRSVQLAGIVPTDPDSSCTGPNGKEWPCGTLARTALRTFLLGRTITCDVADPAWKGSITADCRFARVNLGDWLARNGWAEVASGSPFAGAADEARKAGLGLYGNDPRKKHLSTLAPTPPKEDPLNPI